MANIVAGITLASSFGGLGFIAYQYIEAEKAKLIRDTKFQVEFDNKIEKITTSISQFERIIIERDRANRSDFENMITRHSSEEKMNNLWLGIGTVIDAGVVAGLTGKLVK
jgi:hypothetical protein